jgi:hypothetical protein
MSVAIIISGCLFKLVLKTNRNLEILTAMILSPLAAVT